MVYESYRENNKLQFFKLEVLLLLLRRRRRRRRRRCRRRRRRRRCRTVRASPLSKAKR